MTVLGPVTTGRACWRTWMRCDDADLPVPNSLNTRAGIPGPCSQRLPHLRLDAPPSVGGDELQTEYFVGRDHGVAALEILRSLGFDQRGP